MATLDVCRQGPAQPARVCQGSVVGLLGSNDNQWLAAWLGIVRAGGIVAPLNPMLRTSELSAYLSMLGAWGCIVGQGADGHRPELLDQVPLWSVSELASTMGRLPTPAPHGVCMILPTSGSTGSPKGVQHTSQTLLHAALALASAFPYHSRDRQVACLPFFASLPEQILPTLLTGGAIHAIPRFQASVVADACASATAIDLVPTAMARLLEQADLAKMRGLRWVMFASEPIQPTVLNRWWTELPTVQTHQFYGMIELLTASFLGPELLHRHPDSVGHAFATTRLRVRTDAGKVDAGTGKVVVWCPGRMVGYVTKPNDVGRQDPPDPDIATGDIATVDEEGLIKLVGRSKDLIIRGGMNVAPREIEMAALSHPVVSSALAIGVPDPRWGETPVLVVVPRAGAEMDEHELLRVVTSQLSRYKWPSAAAVLPQLPTTGIVKPDRRRMREAILRGEISLELRH